MRIDPRLMQPATRNKYGAVAVEVDGKRFSSKAEAARYQDLMLLVRAGKISDLRCQVKFGLVPATETTRPVAYVADFVYEEGGNTVVEDVKGVLTPAYKIKRALMAYLHGVAIREVR